MLLMHNRVLKAIVEELSSTKYFSVTVDSTPDISHLDQLTIVVRQGRNYNATYDCVHESVMCVCTNVVAKLFF